MILEQSVLSKEFELLTRKNPTCHRLMRILIFETVATTIFAYGIIATMYPVQPFPVPKNYNPPPNHMHTYFSSMSMLLVLCFSGQLTGCHVNPAVTLSIFLSKGIKFYFPAFLAYIISQFAGGMIGILIGYLMIEQYHCPNYQNTYQNIGLKFVGEVMGTFLFTMFFIILSHPKTKVINSSFWTYNFIAILWLVSRQLSLSTDGLNPAIVLPLQLFYGLEFQNMAPLTTYWIYFLGPFVGSLLSALVFNFFLLPYYLRWKKYKKEKKGQAM